MTNVPRDIPKLPLGVPDENIPERGVFDSKLQEYIFLQMNRYPQRVYSVSCFTEYTLKKGHQFLRQMYPSYYEGTGEWITNNRPFTDDVRFPVGAFSIEEYVT